MANYPKPKKGSRHNAGTGYQSGVRRQLREDRQVQARIRQEAYAKLSTTEKLARLALNGFVAARQRTRLNTQLKSAGTFSIPAADIDRMLAKLPKKARKEKRS